MRDGETDLFSTSYFPLLCPAQGTEGSIAGVVRDASGAVIPLIPHLYERNDAITAFVPSAYDPALAVELDPTYGYIISEL